MTDLRQQFIRGIAQSGKPPLRLVVSNNEAASDWLLRVAPIARQLNADSMNDPKGAE